MRDAGDAQAQQKLQVHPERGNGSIQALATVLLDCRTNAELQLERVCRLHANAGDHVSTEARNFTPFVFVVLQSPPAKIPTALLASSYKPSFVLIRPGGGGKTRQIGPVPCDMDLG